IDDIRYGDKFIELLQHAKLNDRHAGLNPDLLDRLRNPPSSVVNIDDSVVQFSIKMYLTTCEASQKIYESTCRHLCDHFGIEMLSYHNVKNLVADLTGIYPIEVNMCINSCIAY
ncbi:hypothetical protein NEOLEDRAFT_1041478, partial [Neolentinus lepideus HHB14362 ss-1]